MEEIELWNEFWAFAIRHYIFHAVIVTAVVKDKPEGRGYP